MVSPPSQLPRFKKFRLGPQIESWSRRPESWRQVHVVFGGTGAVGGSTALQILDLVHEAARYAGARGESAPRIVITGRAGRDIRDFTRLLYRIHERDHGTLPERVGEIGYRTAGGVLVHMRRFSVNPEIPELKEFPRLDAAGRERVVRELLESRGVDPAAALEDKLSGLEAIVRRQVGRPFSEFLQRYRDEPGLPAEADRFRSVVVGIPLASIAAYHLPDLEQAAAILGVRPGSQEMEALKESYLKGLRDDLALVREALADEVLVAHTTAVGGMYDEDADGKRTIRLGFAHSALDEKLRDKQLFAEKLVKLYSEVGIKMLVTAAAIGVDSVLVRHSPPMNPAIRRLLREAAAAGRPAMPKPDLRQRLRVYPPHDLDLLSEPDELIEVGHGRPLVVDYVLRSGENGYFTASNTDALYRVMRVTSSSELGLVLARCALFGDEDGRSFFSESTCYYTESDYSRQIFDLLGQPSFKRSQVSGLQPKALQDLGSAKHQAELHVLGLLILLHRLKTLDLDAIPLHTDLANFDPQAYFEAHSDVLTLENVMPWEPGRLAEELRTLVTATDEVGLKPLKSYFQADPNRQKAAHRVLQAVLHAAWAVPSIGTPILYESRGRRRVAAGYYAASIDRVVTSRDTFAKHLRERFESLGGGGDEDFDRFVEFHIANNGFADIRPVAVLVTARSDAEDLRGKVRVFRSEAELVAALEALEPYSYFTTSGVIAELVKLRGLCRLAHELDFTLGSANEFRAHLVHDHRDRPLLVPGVVEAFRMVSEGLEKNTGLERLDGRWGYYLPR